VESKSRPIPGAAFFIPSQQRCQPKPPAFAIAIAIAIAIAFPFTATNALGLPLKQNG